MRMNIDNILITYPLLKNIKRRKKYANNYIHDNIKLKMEMQHLQTKTPQNSHTIPTAANNTISENNQDKRDIT